MKDVGGAVREHDLVKKVRNEGGSFTIKQWQKHCASCSGLDDRQGLSLTGIGEALALKVNCPSGTWGVLGSGSEHSAGGVLPGLFEFALGTVL
jgi:hypothetical protein